MITPRILMLCLCAFACASVLGADANSFTFPSAVIKLSSDSWARPVEIEVAKASDYRGGVVKEFGEPAGGRTRLEPLTWQFVGKSDFGDVYVVALAKQGGTREVIPIVFDGISSAVIQRGTFRVEIFLPPARKRPI